MSDLVPLQNQHSKRSHIVWVLPMIIGALVAVIGMFWAYWATVQQIETTRLIEVSKIRSQIISSIEKYDDSKAELIFEYVLKPVDDPNLLSKFKKSVDKLKAEIAPSSPKIETGNSFFVSQNGLKSNEDPELLVSKFNGDERLVASNRLVELYKSNPNKVVAALIDGIVPLADFQRFYRVNLYISFTLSRLSPGWHGTAGQHQSIELLRHTVSYNDPTFKMRVDRAMEKYLGTPKS